jgi:hypothetical protein
MPPAPGTLSPLLQRIDTPPSGDATISDADQPAPPLPPPTEPAGPAGPPPRRRSLGLLDSAVPLLAALVGLIALAGAVLVEMRTDERTRQVAADIAALKGTIAQLRNDTEAVARAQDNGTVEGLLALQDRIARLEEAAKAAAAQPPLAPATLPPTAAPESGAAATPVTAGPTTDCIPVGLRFMAAPNQNYPMCGSGIVLKVGTIGPGTVDFTGTGTVAASGFGTIPGSKCTVMVLSADEAGFAELRVSCG